MLSVSLALFTMVFSPIQASLSLKKKKKTEEGEKNQTVFVFLARNEAVEPFREPGPIFYKLRLRVSRGLQKRKGQGGSKEGRKVKREGRRERGECGQP